MWVIAIKVVCSITEIQLDIIDGVGCVGVIRVSRYPNVKLHPPQPQKIPGRLIFWLEHITPPLPHPTLPLPSTTPKSDITNLLSPTCYSTHWSLKSIYYVSDTDDIVILNQDHTPNICLVFHLVKLSFSISNNKTNIFHPFEL